MGSCLLTATRKPSEIGQRMRTVIERYEAGNVSAAARKLGQSPRGLSKVLSGETTYPRADLLQALVRAYPVDPAWLLTGTPSSEWTVAEEKVTAEAERLITAVLDELRRRRA